MKNFTISLLLLISVFSFNTKLNAACNWKSKITNFYTWDSCSNNRSSLNGYVSFNTKGCFTYQWKVGTTNVGKNSSVVNYKITANGSYTLCVKITDTCNKCDTTLCASFTISCLSNCNWKALSPYFNAFDTCKGTGSANSLNAYLSLKSRTCQKYSWTVNGVAKGGNNYYINYPITANGTYNLCLKVTDTCNHCDTTFCSTRTITCFTTPCAWKKYIGMNLFNNCANNKDTAKAYIYSQNTISCAKITWTLNGNVIATNKTNLNYPVLQNGSYQLCVKITDTCNKCDTTICKSFTVTCLSSGKCNWKSRSPNFAAWDTCTGKNTGSSVNAYIAFNSKSCLKYAWTVNGVAKSGNTYYFNYPVTNNGTYSMCVKVTDTCDKCDTTYCFAAKTISCFSNCNWKGKTNYYFWDSCKGSGTTGNSVNAYIAIKSGSCYKYQWTVNNVAAGNGNILHHKITANGTYSVCIKVIDTCNHCDTTFCSTRTITCYAGKCNWKNLNPYFSAWDTCKGNGYRNSVNAYISFKSRTCQKYSWTVNGVAKGSNNYFINYPITANGTYVLCVKVTDTCNKCDTSFCSTRTITCFTKCNFKSNNQYFLTYDSCSGTKAAVGGYISFYNSSCLKYKWTVAGVNSGTNQYFGSYVFKNGTYSICVKVTDTCKKCDTTYCETRKVNCNNLGLNSESVNQNITVYPNPVNSLLTIGWNGSDTRFDVISILGSLIYKGELKNGENLIQTDTWENGVYMIRVNTDTGLRTLKIVVNR